MATESCADSIQCRQYNADPMRSRLRKIWPFVKFPLAIIILVLIGRRFAIDLQSHPDLLHMSLGWGWLALSGGLYIAGLACSNIYWLQLLRLYGQSPRPAAAVRAYYIGMMGKYVPGKAWALVLRATLIAGPRVSAGIAVLTSFYEILTTMTSGAALATVLYFTLAPDLHSHFDWSMFWTLMQLQPTEEFVFDRKVLTASSLLLTAAVGIPIIPTVFNWVVHRMSLPFRAGDAALPRVHLRSLATGLSLTAVNWLFMGISFWAAAKAVVGPSLRTSLQDAGLYIAAMGASYVAGFVFIIVPSGLGVREFFLTLFLVPELHLNQGIELSDARALAVVAAVILRLAWTVAELCAVAVVYWLPGPAPQG